MIKVLDGVFGRVIEFLYFYLYVITFAFAFVGLFLLPKGHEIIEGLVVLSVLFGLFNFFVNKSRLDHDVKVLVFILFFYGFTILVNHFIHGDWYRYGKAFVFMVFFVLFMPELKCIKKVVLYSVIVGSVALGLLSLHQYSSGSIRVNGFTNSIPFSQALLVVFIFNFYFISRVEGFLKLAVFFSIIATLFSLYLSQTRGVWLAILVILFFYMVIGLIKRPVIFMTIAIILVATSFAAYDASGLVKDKINSGFMDLEKAKRGDLNTSWGLRIVAWDSAFKAIDDNLLIGVGRDNFYIIKQQQVNKSLVSSLALHPALAHTHNQYLQSQLIRGLPGTLSLILLIIFPFLYFGFFNVKGLVFKAVALAFGVFSLSDVPFEHLNTIYLYTVSMALACLFSTHDEMVLE